MTHLFKVQSKYADMFVSSINLEEQTISYQMRDDMGKAIESLKTEKFIQEGETVHFHSKNLPLKLFNHIHNIIS